MYKDKILELLGEIVEIEKKELAQMPLDTKLVDIGLESIQFIQFIVAVEDTFNIEVLDSDLLISKFETIEMVYQTLEKYILCNVPLKKVLICDCDNVLWCGIAGEEPLTTNSLTNLLQETILSLYRQGIIICLCSKNQKANIEDAFSTLEMPLKKEHILLSRINMTDKATNIKDIAKELNLSTDSFVFVDDSIYELDLVSSLVPEITVVHADYSNKTFIDTVKSLFSHSSTDINRTQQYREQKEREKEKLHYNTPDEFNASLQTKTNCEIATTSQAARISELSQRTNQFNLSNSRYTEKQIYDLIRDDEYAVYTLSVSDKYGDMGIVGAAIIHKMNKPVILDFYLSCRVFGRRFEEVLINRIKSDFPKFLKGIYNKTTKNKNFESFYSENGVKYE